MARQSWVCTSCKEALAMEAERPPDPAQRIMFPSEQSIGQTATEVHIMQWNANGILREVEELEQYITTRDIDVCCVQESKLLPKDTLPSMSNYNVVRKDRIITESGRGGGLLTFIKKGIPYSVTDMATDEQNPALEKITVDIPLSVSTSLKVTNVYISPEYSPMIQRLANRRVELNMELDENEILVGDLNGHDEAWDATTAHNQRGRDIVDWMLDQDGVIINDGSATRSIPGGDSSSPDVTIAHQSIAEKCQWQVCDGLNSDHKPIRTTIDLSKVNGKGPRRMRWNWKDADWNAFTAEVDEQLCHTNASSGSVKVVEESVRSTIMKAAYAHVGLKAVGMNQRVWLTREVDNAIKQRDALRATCPATEDEYHEQDRLVKEMLCDLRKDIWRRKVVEAQNTTEMWRLVRNLNEGTRKEDDSKALEVDGRKCVTNKQKANAFRSSYAKVSKLKIKKEDRWIKKEANEALRTMPPTDSEESSPITSREMIMARNQINPNKSPGPDHLHPKFIHHLGPKSLEVIKELFNKVWELGTVPQLWRTADIRPILKKGKNSADLISYRPISLTSAMGKWMERVVTNRLTYILESKGLLNVNQAGFRANKGTEDQLIRLSQSISDGFQAKPMERTVLVLLDYSKAYDTVWRDALVLKMVRKGLPVKLIRWTQNWMSNRINWVTYGGTRSKKITFKQGVPQGSVISPILFLLYIDDLCDDMPANGAEVSLFADDTATWARSSSLAIANQKAQEMVDHIAAWSRRWKLTLSTAKCEASFFSTNTHEAEWRPIIKIDDSAINYNANPIFLGVKYDRQLTFGPHCSDVCRKMKQRSGALQKLAGTDWGWDKETLRMTYIATGRSLLDYALPAWVPWLSTGNCERLEQAQRHAARSITGLVKTTPSEALHIEANLPTVQQRARQICVIALEKSHRLEDNNPRRQIAQLDQRKRTTKTDWRDSTRMHWLDVLPEINRKEFPLMTKPWSRLCNVTFPVAQGRLKEDEDNREEGLKAINHQIEQYDAVIYTDGSVPEGQANGGAGVVHTCGDPRAPEVVQRYHFPAGSICSSFQAEMVAICEALRIISTQCIRKTKIITDSLASQLYVRTLTQSNRPRTSVEAEILTLLEHIGAAGGEIELTWCASHCGVEGNELADREAAIGTGMDQANTEDTFACAKSAIRRNIKPAAIIHERLRATYGPNAERQPARKEEGVSCRKDQVTLARIRAGHHPDTLYWQHKIGKSESDTCRLCGLEVETTTHIATAECPALSQFTINSQSSGGLATRRPKDILSIWEAWRKRIGDLEN